MTSKKFDREQIQRCLDVLDILARSGLSTEDFAQAQGLSYGQLRSWLSHGPRWRLQLADPADVAPARRRAGKGTGFVQVNVGDGQTPAANAGHAAQTAQWLKAYLA